MPILWSALEPCLAITLACVPLLRPLLGGRYYTKTGTARAGGGGGGLATRNTQTRTRTVTQKGSRRFDRLQDESSIRQLVDGNVEAEVEVEVELELEAVSAKRQCEVKEQGV